MAHLAPQETRRFSDSRLRRPDRGSAGQPATEVDIPGLYDPDGRYGRWNVIAITTYVGGVLVQIQFLAQSLYTGPVTKRSAVRTCPGSWGCSYQASCTTSGRAADRSHRRR